ncbi:hypothetical protein FGU65_08575 [Methanoculleus sp. FWC-SCC1]|uniref:Uncharacterized protein n=1 Tax=Methanoculleus frigidifontis TaxID=2584085 RepID=A0ABT8MAI3_9EURY|nr:hypothetical protein [Methanoculleus sp. FWC-SCC1]MDN7024940.1 hypothetical protein [Methanoculleus sp. FWC-SCC1]
MEPAGEKTVRVYFLLALVLFFAGIFTLVAASSPQKADDRFDDALLELDQALVELEHLEQRNTSTAPWEAREKVSAAVEHLRRTAEEKEVEIDEIETTYAALDRRLAALPDGASAPEAAGAIADEVHALRVAWHRQYASPSIPI